MFGGGAYYRVAARDGSGDSQFIYFCGTDGPLTAFLLVDGGLSRAILASGEPNQSAETYASGTPIVSSNGTVPRTGIVWMIARQNPLRLLVFDATDLTRKLLDVEAGPWNNAGGGPFSSPRSSTARCT